MQKSKDCNSKGGHSIEAFMIYIEENLSADDELYMAASKAHTSSDIKKLYEQLCKKNTSISCSVLRRSIEKFLSDNEDFSLMAS